MGATWQRCRADMRNALAYVPKAQNSIAAAALRQAFLQPDAEAAHQAFRHVADQMRDRWPKLAAFMDASEHDVLAYMGIPAQRRAAAVGIFPNEASIIRLIGAVLPEQNDEWQTQNRDMQVEAMAELLPIEATPAITFPPKAA